MKKHFFLFFIIAFVFALSGFTSIEKDNLISNTLHLDQYIDGYESCWSEKKYSNYNFNPTLIKKVLPSAGKAPGPG